jgi:hypothetical protein
MSEQKPQSTDTHDAAKKLSTLGASKGGKARAAALSSEERSAIAKHAAAARWGESDLKVPVETHEGSIEIGNVELKCGVLDNGIRVFSTRGITRALGGRQTGTSRRGKNGVPQLPPFLESEGIKPFISSQLMARLITPIQYRPKHGGRTAFGYEASLLPELCELILDANEAKPLKANQQHMVKTANLLIRGFARVGIIALVDEATGYQEERARDELSKILSAYIVEELRPYISKFPNEFFKQIYRIHGWDYKPGVTKGPRYIGKFINKYIYEPLPPGVLTRLRALNPTNEKGQRKYKHFQFLTESIGDPHIDKQVAVATGLLKLSDTKQEFEDNFKKVFARQYQPRLSLIIDAEE